MRALIHDEYGRPTDVLRVADVPEPEPGPREILVRVRAAAVNAADWHLVRGLPMIVRASGWGVRRPRRPQVGSDAAGQVVAVGPAVTRFQPGDQVVAWGTGALAELMVAREEDAVHRPAEVDEVAGAALPLAGTTALQGLRDRGRLVTGRRVLITGASGGVGHLAVQIARATGAEVTGSCSTGNVDLVRSLGAERVLDYSRDPVPGTGPYDLILHIAGPTSVLAMRRALAPAGALVMANGDGGRWLGPLPAMLRAVAISVVSSQRMGFYVATTARDDVQTLVDMAAAGTIRPVVDRVHDLSEAATAVAHVAEGHPRGKVVVTT